MDDEQLNGRRTARHGAAAMAAETVITEERPGASAGSDSGAAPAAAMDQYTRRRLAAEAAADAAEAAAAEAAGRAAAAIKAAARAAEEAEAAADAAAQAADAVLVATEAESRAQAVRRSAPPRALHGHAEKHPGNGYGTNGAGRNGTGLNGTGLDGAGLNGAGLNGAGLNGAGLNGAGLPGPATNEHANGEIPFPTQGLRGNAAERTDDTTVIPPVRTGGRRRRRAEDEVDEPGHGTDVSAGAGAGPEAPAEVTTVVPPTRDRLDAPATRATDGRAARRRAKEAAAAVALEASRDPVTDAITVMEPAARPVREAATQVVPARPGEFDEFGDYGRDDFDGEFDVDRDFDRDYDQDFDDDDRPVTPLVTRNVDDDEDKGVRSWFGRPVVYAVCGVLVIIGLIAALVLVLGGGGSTATPAASGPAQQPAAPAAGAEAAGAVDKIDPTSEKAVAFLDAMRESGITTSRSGLSETQAAAGICNQLSDGVSEATLAKSLPTQLPTVSKKQSPLFVELAQEHYC